MMNKHDETIQNLFEDYANDLAPREDLAERAKMEMVERKAQPSTSARKNSSAWIHLAWLAPVAVVFVAVIAVIFTLPIFSGFGNMLPEEQAPSQQPTNAVTYYTYADVRGRSVDINDYDDALNISSLKANDYQLVGQRCYAFFTEDGELR